ncbi:MAG: hypothetical protein JNM09_00975 [Blastocatellia bacterium]|nr:hypothetical protein [Blastocatellia bacterium]
MSDTLKQKIAEHGSLTAYYHWLDRPPMIYDDDLEECLEAEERERERQWDEWAREANEEEYDPTLDSEPTSAEPTPVAAPPELGVKPDEGGEIPF